MKSIKFMMMTLMMCLMTMVSFGQDTLKFTQLNDASIWKSYDFYISKDGTLYHIGDTIQIKSPSGVNGKFVYINKMTIMGDIMIVGPEATNTFTTIKKIKINGGKNSRKVLIQTKGYSIVDNYFIDLESAIDNKEVKSKVMSSDEALVELKKLKDKLDLGLISQDTYDKKKLELLPFIK